MCSFQIENKPPQYTPATSLATRAQGVKPPEQLRSSSASVAEPQSPVASKGMTNPERSGVLTTMLKAVSNSFQKIFTSSGEKQTGEISEKKLKAFSKPTETIKAAAHRVDVQNISKKEAEAQAVAKPQVFVFRNTPSGFSAVYCGSNKQLTEYEFTDVGDGKYTCNNFPGASPTTIEKWDTVLINNQLMTEFNSTNTSFIIQFRKMSAQEAAQEAKKTVSDLSGGRIYSVGEDFPGFSCSFVNPYTNEVVKQDYKLVPNSSPQEFTYEGKSFSLKKCIESINLQITQLKSDFNDKQIRECTEPMHSMENAEYFASRDSSKVYYSQTKAGFRAIFSDPTTGKVTFKNLYLDSNTHGNYVDGKGNGSKSIQEWTKELNQQQSAALKKVTSEGGVPIQTLRQNEVDLNAAKIGEAKNKGVVIKDLNQESAGKEIMGHLDQVIFRTDTSFVGVGVTYLKRDGSVTHDKLTPNKDGTYVLNGSGDAKTLVEWSKQLKEQQVAAVRSNASKIQEAKNQGVSFLNISREVAEKEVNEDRGKFIFRNAASFLGVGVTYYYVNSKGYGQVVNDRLILNENGLYVNFKGEENTLAGWNKFYKEGGQTGVDPSYNALKR